MTALTVDQIAEEGDYDMTSREDRRRYFQALIDNGGIPASFIVDAVKHANLTPGAAYQIGAALAYRWGSWSAFDRQRKEETAENAIERKQQWVENFGGTAG